MPKSTFTAAALASMLFTGTAVVAAPVDDATAMVTNVIDKFNDGNTRTFLSAHVDNAVIIDEFAPYVWSGRGTARRWLSDYNRMTKRQRVTDARLDYGKPIRADLDGKRAYIVLPTTYSFVQSGVKESEVSTMTFVVRRVHGRWKIASWTFSGNAPAPTI